MDQPTVRRYVEKYLAAFSTHVMETHPDFLTVVLPVEVDKDIGNRPFYWSWVEKMNIAPQPMQLTFYFDQDAIPAGKRGELVHFGSPRLQQIFQSARKHGRFVCLYEQAPHLIKGLGSKRSAPLTPWLGLNVKVSLLCDKKRDILLQLGINLHQPHIVHRFYDFVRGLTLTPAIPDYFYTLDRRLSVEQAYDQVQQEVRQLLDREDHTWADAARERLQEEVAILEAYYEELAAREPESDHEQDAEDKELSSPDTEAETPQEQVDSSASESEPLPAEDSASAVAAESSPAGSFRILDFLRANGIPETPKEAINQEDWRKSTPAEEKARRLAELNWQYEPRIDISVINAGLFYLHNQPPFSV